METNKQLLHQMTTAVYWGEMDALGHVNNSVYFRYFEQIRVEWFSKIGKNVINQSQTDSPVLITTHATFLRPVTYPAKLHISLYGEAPGHSSFNTTYEIKDTDKDTLVTTGEAKIVWIDIQSQKPISVPESIRKWLPKSDKL